MRIMSSHRRKIALATATTLAVLTYLTRRRPRPEDPVPAVESPVDPFGDSETKALWEHIDKMLLEAIRSWDPEDYAILMGRPRRPAVVPYLTPYDWFPWATFHQSRPACHVQDSAKSGLCPLAPGICPCPPIDIALDLPDRSVSPS